MSDPSAQIDALTRKVANLDSATQQALSHLQQLGGGGGVAMASGSGNMLSSALGSFSQTASNNSGVGAILGGLGQMGAGAVAGVSMSMPSVTATMSRSAAFYRSALYSPGLSTSAISSSTMNAMRGGMTSPGSDAMTAGILSGMGISPSTSQNSTYQQMLRSTANAAKYLGMDNATAAQAIGGLTSGSMSAQLQASLGIYTSDVRGKPRTMNQIFGDISSMMTAGQPKMSAEDVNTSFYRGNMGASLDNLGFSAAQKELFRQYMVDKAQGKTMDLSSNAATKKLMAGMTNPDQPSLDIYSTMTGQMQTAQEPYLKGMQDAAKWFEQLNPQVEDLIKNFGRLNSALQTGANTPVGQGIATGGSMMLNGAIDVVGGVVDVVKSLLGAGGGAAAAAAVGGPSSGIKLGSKSATPTSGGMSIGHKPANGPVTAVLHEMGPHWGPGGHNGTDYGVPDGSPIYAAADGVVKVNATSQAADGGYGHYLTLDHGNGYTTLYAHLSPSSALVRPGDTVKAGQRIGISGHTGNVTGPHLHFEVRQNGTSVDPNQFLSGAVKINPPKGSGSGSTSTGDNVFDTVFSSFGGFIQSAGQALGVSTNSAPVSVPSWTGVGASSASSPHSSSMNAAPSTGVGGMSSGVGLGSTSGMASAISTLGSGKIEINLHIAQANEVEAKKFAKLVKGYLENDLLINGMGSY